MGARKLVLLCCGIILFFCPSLTLGRHLPFGDLNVDYKVDSEDLDLFVQQWLNPSDCSGPSCANFDGVNGVDFRDLALLTFYWHTGYHQPTLVINEFMAANSGYVLDEYENSDDWIELYNYGDAPVDIADMYMSDTLANPTEWQVPDNNSQQTIIPPHSYLLIWADDEQDEGTLHAPFKLSAGDGDQIYLYDAAGNLIDSIVFGPQNTNESYGRLPDGTANWQTFTISTSPPPTPGKANAGAPSANQIVINEIMYNTSSLNELEEYIEIYNQGSTSVGLGNWSFIDGVSFTFPPDTNLPAGEYLVIAADVTTFNAKYPSVTNVIGSWVGQLSRRGERITLVDEVGVVIDEVKYADEGDWAQRLLGPLDYEHRGWKWSDETDGGGKSLELINPGMPNEYGQNWTASSVDQGTPGAPNPSAQSNTAPFIIDAKHHPFIPTSSDTVTVKAQVIDELSSGVTVTLNYRVDGAGSFTQINMTDDGLNGDELAGDGIYAAQIPPQAHKIVIEFYIEADDSSSNTRTFPAPSDVDGTPSQVTNMLYVVDDTFNPVWTAGNQPIYYIIMTTAERTELEEISDEDSPHFIGENMSNAQMNATFISLDGTDMKIRYNTGVRNRGNRSRNDPPMNYRVNFRNDDLWKDISAITINSKYGFLQVIGSAMFRLADLPAPITKLIEVRVNGDNIALTDESHMYGSYANLETYNTYWVENHFPDDPDGNLYRCSYFENTVDPQTFADLIYKGTDPDDYINNYIKQTNEEETDYNDIFNLTFVLSPEYINGIPDVNFFEEVNDVIHIDGWMRHLAVNTLIGNIEGGLITGDGDDYAMYRGVIDTRFWLMPHDLDTIYSGDIYRSIFSYENMDGLYRLFNDPQIVQIYYRELYDLVNTIFTAENLNDALDNILANSYVPQANIDAMKQYAANRAASVLSQIPQDFSAGAALPVSSGYYRTDANIAVVSGTANSLETKSVLVNGLKADWDAISGQWSFGEGGGDIISQTTLVEEDSAKTILVPSEAVPDTWRSDPGFDDSNWTDYTYVSGKSGSVGYERGSGYENYISYDVESDFYGINTSCLIRTPFVVTTQQLAEFNFMTLQMRYDDGFAAFINGQLVASQYAPDPLYWDSSTSNGNDHEAGLYFDEFTINNHIPVLQEGVNILAIHALNVSPTSSDFLSSARLIAGTMGETYQGVALNPGINRVVIQTFDQPDGAGNKLHEDYVDVWYDTGGGDFGEVTYETTLVTEDAPKNVLIPSAAVDDAWRSDPNFDDSLWNDYTFISGMTGSVGYDDGSDYDPYISYDVISTMDGVNNTCLIRIPFTVTAEDIAVLNFMILQMRYDDGFVAYINGQEIASEYKPDPLTWNSSTLGGGLNEASSSWDEYPASNFISVLNEGENILAIHGLNESTTSSDFIISAQLIAGTISSGDPGEGAVVYYYSTLTEDTTWTTSEGPYQIIGDLVVPSGIKLTIGPGTSVYFDEDSSIVVNGIIDANGSEYQRIRMTSIPGATYVEDIRPELPFGPPKWNGVQLQNTMSPLNRIAYTDIEHAQTSDGAIGMVNSEALIDNVSFAGSYLRNVSTESSSVIIRNSTFPDMYTEDQWPHLMTPPLDNVTEHINAVGGIPPGGYYIIENNIFGKNKGHNDVIDFTGHVDQLPVVQVLNNIFTGGGDEALDLGGDAYIEGNIFTNFHKDASNTSAGNSNAMSTGDDMSGEDDSVITAVRNKFYDLDYVVTFKFNTFLNFENNTVVDIPDDAGGVEYSALLFYSVEKPEPQGKGAFLNNNIFWQIPQRIFGNVDVSDPYNPSFMTDLEMHNTLVPPERADDVVASRPGTIMDLGVNNIAADPLFTDPNDDLSLLSMSPAVNAGDNGIDMGADVPAGASISGEPIGGITYQTSVTLTVAGPAITDYMYKVNDGSWSSETSVTVPITLVGLSNGESYTVYVLGKNNAGVWQTEPAVSETFSIDTSYYRLVINEVLAHSHGTAPDIVEIYYDGPAPLDITGYSITDNPDYPQKFVFPATTIMNPGQYKVYYADTNEALPDILGFSLDSYGEGLYLYDNFGYLIDSIEFGIQLNGMSIGRLDDDQWHATVQTFGSENIPQMMASPYRVKINEWIANTDVRFEDDIIELYNPSPLPVDLGGLYITDDPFARPARQKIKQFTFAPANGFAFFYADGDELSRSNHLNFRLSADDGLIALFDYDLKKIDEVIYYSQTADFSQGRYPDGAPVFMFFELPTPERSNVQDPGFVTNNIGILNNLRITELMYNTPDVNDVDEYIELHNTGATTLDISGVQFIDGVTYIFPNNTSLPASAYIVLAADPVAFKAQYPLVADNLIYGPYEGALDNGGEKVVLTLADPMLAAVLRFEYDDAWYPDTDGLGDSLSIIDPTVVPKDWDKPESWQAALPTPAAPNPAQSEWDILTYDDFEAGWGNYVSGGEDALLYTSGTYAHQASNAANIQHAGSAAGFSYQNPVDINTPGYTQLEIDFWFYALDMEEGESFVVGFYDGAVYHIAATYVSGTDFANNNFYHETIYLEEGTGPGQYNFPADMNIRFECYASSNTDDIYIDQVKISAK